MKLTKYILGLMLILTIINGISALSPIVCDANNPVKTTTLKIGNGYVDYYDNGNFPHKIPFYIALDSTMSMQGSFTIDEQTFYYRVNDSPVTFKNKKYDGNFQVSRVPFVMASAKDYLSSAYYNYSFYYNKVTKSNDLSKFSSPGIITLKGTGTNNKGYYYGYYRGSTGYNKIYLLLRSFNSSFYKNLQENSVQYKAYDQTPLGTDTKENGFVDKGFYLPDLGEAFGIAGGQADYSYYVAKFRFKDDTGTGYVYIDTTTGKLLQFPNNNLSYYTHDFVYNGKKYLSNDATKNSNYACVTPYGSKLSIVNDYFEAIVPDKYCLDQNVLVGTLICK